MIFVCKSVSNPNFKYVMLKRVNTPTRYLSALTTHTKHQLVQISLKYTSTHYYPPPASHKKYPGALTHPKNIFTPPPHPLNHEKSGPTPLTQNILPLIPKQPWKTSFHLQPPKIYLYQPSFNDLLWTAHENS